VESELEKAKVELEDNREAMLKEAQQHKEALDEQKKEVEALKKSLQNLTRDQV
jgi:DNA repair exonuclease SbcCD ATPase subunit